MLFLWRSIYIDNYQKYFLSSKSEYYNDFWRSCDIEDWRNDAENTAAHHRNKLHFIQIEMTVHHTNVFTVFFKNIKLVYAATTLTKHTNETLQHALIC